MDEAEVGRLVGDVTISYSVRELLSRIEERQVRTDTKIEQLASLHEVEELARMVSRHEARWNRMIGAALAVGALAGGASGWLTQVLAAGH
jgi:hypothetical protein